MRLLDCSVKLRNYYWEFPGGPLVGTSCLHCWGLGCIPGHLALKKKKKKRVIATSQPLNYLLQVRYQPVYLWTHAAREGSVRGWSCPSNQLSPWDQLPNEEPWPHAGKNSGVSQSRVKASLFTDKQFPWTECIPLRK